MSIRNLNTLFSSAFYIDGRYAESFIPVFAGLIQGKLDLSTAEKPLVQIDSHQLNVHNGSTQEDRTVAVVSIKNPIIKFSTWNIAGTREIWSKINQLDQDPSIAGIVLDIDSGGGQVYGTPEFFDNIRNIQTPVVAYTDGFMCSAAYYIAAACDHIIANKRADAIGSIGAYAQFFDFSGFWEKHGAKMHTLYADKSSEKNKGYRDVLEGEYKTYISESLNPTVETFIADMKSARPSLSEEVFKGKTWTGPEAIKRNLVDSLGSIQDAIAKAFELSSNNKSKTTNMSTPNSYPNLEATLELSAPLASTDNGSYLNEEQKATLDQKLADMNASLETANAAKEKAEQDLQAEKDSHAAALDAEKETALNAVTSLRAAATLAGVEDIAEDASLEDINDALTAKINMLNDKPGAEHTANGSDDPAPSEFDYVDFNSSIYNKK